MPKLTSGKGKGKIQLFRLEEYYYSTTAYIKSIRYFTNSIGCSTRYWHDGLSLRKPTDRYGEILNANPEEIKSRSSASTTVNEMICGMEHSCNQNTEYMKNNRYMSWTKPSACCVVRKQNGTRDDHFHGIWTVSLTQRLQSVMYFILLSAWFSAYLAGADCAIKTNWAILRECKISLFLCYVRV